MSTPAPPLEDENLLPEILLRLPPQPSSLPRASAVCTRWRHLVSDPSFVRRFRRHHRRSPPPLLGFFYDQGIYGIEFEPTMEPPDCIPPGRFSMLSDAGLPYRLIGCRHGLVLMFDPKMQEFLVWDPVAGDQHRLAVPPEFDRSKGLIVGTVLRPAGDAHHFQVVFAGSDVPQKHIRMFVRIYSSETGVWSDLISTLPPSGAFMKIQPAPAVLVGDSLYWRLAGNSCAILEFDLDMQSLAVIHLPMHLKRLKRSHYMVMPAEGGGLGVFLISDFTTQSWKRNVDRDGVASWVLGRTIQLDTLLSLNSDDKWKQPRIIGFAECNNVVFLSTVMGIFMLQIESLQFKIFFNTSMVSCCHPFETVYAAGI